MDTERNKTILIVDDDIHLREGLMELLSVEGYTAIGAENGVIALELARQNSPDLILLDIMMPHMDGLTTLKELQKESRLAVIPVIFLTALGEKANIRSGLRLGAEDYIVKPFDTGDLTIRIESVLYRRELLANANKLVSIGLNHHIFLSYSRKDEEVMRRVRDDLKTKSLLVWVDEDGLNPGTRSWKKTIQKAIDGVGCVAVILSPDAKESEWVEAELDYAEAQGKTIFPILARGTKQNAVPFGYTLAQWIDIVEKDYDMEMGRLITAIRKHLNLT